MKHWLIRAAIHSCYDYIKKNRRTISLDQLPDEPSFVSDDAYDISWALMKVKPNYREILYLHYCERYQIKEIAGILGRNANTSFLPERVAACIL